MAVYMTAVRIVAMSNPPPPPSASPNCQPEISPEMTYATPSPARSTQPAAPFCSCRCSRYSSSTFSYSTPCVVRLSSRSLIWTSFSSPYFPYAPYQPRNDRHINGHRFPRQQSAGDPLLPVCAAEQNRVSMIHRRNEEKSARKVPTPGRQRSLAPTRSRKRFKRETTVSSQPRKEP